MIIVIGWNKKKVHCKLHGEDPTDVVVVVVVVVGETA